MYDSILYYSKIAERKSSILKDLELLTPNSARAIHESPLHRTPNYYLATLHRAENTDDPKKLKSILKALDEIGRNTPTVLPLHPRTKKMMEVYRLFPGFKNIRFIEPLSYFDMLKLEKNAVGILTDSGGVQKEAYWLRVPCFTLRGETEWVETVQSRWNTLVGTERKKIVRAVNHLQKKTPSKKSTNVFGDGKACEMIIGLLVKSSKLR
jgi:UDP-N-acetylglucosamine 2-epimerase